MKVLRELTTEQTTFLDFDTIIRCRYFYMLYNSKFCKKKMSKPGTSPCEITSYQLRNIQVIVKACQNDVQEQYHDKQARKTRDHL